MQYYLLEEFQSRFTFTLINDFMNDLDFKLLIIRPVPVVSIRSCALNALQSFSPKPLHRRNQYFSPDLIFNSPSLE